MKAAGPTSRRHLLAAQKLAIISSSSDFIRGIPRRVGTMVDALKTYLRGARLCLTCTHPLARS